MVDRRCWAEGQLRALFLYGRSCVTSGSFPAMKSRIFPLRLVLLSSSAVRRRKDPDEQLAFHYEIQHWGRAGPSATGADLSLFLSRTGSSCWGEMLPPSFTEQRQQQRRRCFSDGDVTLGGRRGGSIKTLKSGSCSAENFPLWVWFLQLLDGSIICFCAADVRLSDWEFSALQTLSWARAGKSEKRIFCSFVLLCAVLRVYVRFHQVYDRRRVTCRSTDALSSWRDGQARVAGLVLQAEQKTSGHVEQTRPGLMRPMMSQCPGLTARFLWLLLGCLRRPY